MSANIRLSKSEEERIKLMSSYIENHLHEKLSVPFLSAIYWMQAKKINEGFRKLYGMNVHRYIITSRMRTAMFFIKNSDKLIKEIARECGYKDIAGFSRTFKKFYGKPPEDYRKNL